MALAPPQPFAKDVEPWERQPREPDAAFACFKHYRDAVDERGDPARSIRGTASAVGEHGTSCARWSVRHRWRDRALAYDRYLDTVARRIKEKELAGVLKQHASVASAGIGVLQEPIRELIRRIESKTLVLKDISDVALLRLVRQSAAAFKDLVGIQRVALGVPETVFGVGVGTPATFAAMVQQLFEGGGDDAPNPLAAFLAGPPPAEACRGPHLVTVHGFSVTVDA